MLASVPNLPLLKRNLLSKPKEKGGWESGFCFIVSLKAEEYKKMNISRFCIII